jgi:hypothetical protein
MPCEHFPNLSSYDYCVENRQTLPVRRAVACSAKGLIRHFFTQLARS